MQQPPPDTSAAAASSCSLSPMAFLILRRLSSYSSLSAWDMILLPDTCSKQKAPKVGMPFTAAGTPVQGPGVGG